MKGYFATNLRATKVLSALFGFVHIVYIWVTRSRTIWLLTAGVKSLCASDSELELMHSMMEGLQVPGIWKDEDDEAAELQSSESDVPLHVAVL